MIGQRIGKIRIVDRMGQGSMGELYVGVDEKLNRMVAVRELRNRQKLQPQARARLLREAQILSQLDHRHTRRIHDLIEWQGEEYLVLELIEGQSLNQAMTEKMSHTEKLRIAGQIAEVLAVAHSRSIVHCDLRPANIILTPSGDIKVIDFGLSRFLEADGVVSGVSVGRGDSDSQNEPAAKRTRHDREQVHGPVERASWLDAYKSPEQKLGETANVAGDLYSLGLILQRLFTGRHPSGEGTTAESGEAADARQPAVDADLAALIERLTAVVPSERPSAVDTIERLSSITDKPRRRRWRILAASAIVLLVIVATVLTAQAVRIAREVERANQAAAAERRISDFLVQLLLLSDPWGEKGGATTSREILDLGTERIREEFGDSPLTKARLMNTLGGIYQELGLFDRAEPLLKEALNIRLRLLPEDHPDLAENLRSLGFFYKTIGRYSEAESLFNSSLASFERALGPEHPSVATVLNNLATLYHTLADYERAEPLYRRSLAIREKAFGESEVTTESLNNLADVYRALGEYERAEQLHLRSISIVSQSLGKDHPAVSVYSNNLAFIYYERGEYERAEQQFERYLRTTISLYGRKHHTVAIALTNNAKLLYAKSEYDRAQPLLEEALVINRNSLKLAHPWTARTINELAAVATRQDRFDDAESLYEHSQQVWQQLDLENPGRLNVQYGLAHTFVGQGVLRIETGDRQGAAEACQKALDITSPLAATETTELLNAHAMALLCVGRIDEARSVVARLRARGWCNHDLADLCRRHGLAYECGMAASLEARPKTPVPPADGS
jgi:serine/threonine protein kinase/Tfp pilus assembly protein PilF